MGKVEKLERALERAEENARAARGLYRDRNECCADGNCCLCDASSDAIGTAEDEVERLAKKLAKAQARAA